MTFIFIILTVIISVLCFQNRELFARLQFNAYQVYHRKEYYRVITHAFVHANWAHLIVNVFVLYIFGRNVEGYLRHMASQGMINSPMIWYIVFYLTAVIFSTSISLVKHKDDIMYNAVGASGAVSALLFFFIFFNPWEKLYLYFALPIPAIIFAVVYVIYSQYMSKRNMDNIGHDAHLLGAVYGFIFPLFIDISLIKYFISQLLAF